MRRRGRSKVAGRGRRICRGRRAGLNGRRIAIGFRAWTQHPRCRLFTGQVLRHAALSAKLFVVFDVSSAVGTPTRHIAQSPQP